MKLLKAAILLLLLASAGVGGGVTYKLGALHRCVLRPHLCSDAAAAGLGGAGHALPRSAARWRLPRFAHPPAANPDFVA
jgi:hypothetical protein